MSTAATSGKAAAIHSLGGKLLLVPDGGFLPESVPLNELLSIQLTLQVTKKGYSTSVAIAAALISPTGALAGMTAVGNKTHATFVATLTRKRQLVATTDADTYKKLVGAAVDAGAFRQFDPERQAQMAAIEQRREEAAQVIAKRSALAQCGRCGRWSLNASCVCGNENA